MTAPSEKSHIGWTVPAHLSEGVDRESAVREAFWVVDPVVKVLSVRNGAVFVFGPDLFATIEPRGAWLWRCRYSRYTAGIDAEIARAEALVFPGEAGCA